MNLPEVTIEELLEAGVHFGHPTSRWNPNFKQYIAMKKNGIHIIDLESTIFCLEKDAKSCSPITILAHSSNSFLSKS